MNNHYARQLGLFSDGARPSPSASDRGDPPADAQAKLDAARARLRELVVFGMKTWLPSVTLQRLAEAEQWRREARMPSTCWSAFASSSGDEERSARP
jgi:hypothetical protein